MKRYNDIMETLAEVDENLIQIRAQYEKARSDDEIQSVLRPKITSTTTLLRSALDYIGKEIAIYLTGKPNIKSAYFPYALDGTEFRKKLDGYLRNIDITHPDIFAALENVQPHKCGDDWLFRLCDANNSAKHDKLLAQKRKNSASHDVYVDGQMIGRGAGRVTFIDSKFNGKLVGTNAPLVLAPDVPVKEMRKNAGGLHVDRKFDKVEFHIDGTNADMLTLLTKARQEIALLAESFNRIIP